MQKGRKKRKTICGIFWCFLWFSGQDWCTDFEYETWQKLLESFEVFVFFRCANKKLFKPRLCAEKTFPSFEFMHRNDDNKWKSFAQLFRRENVFAWLSRPPSLRDRKLNSSKTILCWFIMRSIVCFSILQRKTVRLHPASISVPLGSQLSFSWKS